MREEQIPLKELIQNAERTYGYNTKKDQIDQLSLKELQDLKKEYPRLQDLAQYLGINVGHLGQCLRARGIYWRQL